MIANVGNALQTILGNVAALDNAAGAGRIFELLVMTHVAVGLKSVGFEVWLQRSDGTRINQFDADRTFIQRGGAPTGVSPASDGALNASVIGFRYGSGPAWEIWNGIQFQGRSGAKHEFDLAVVPQETAAALRVTGGCPTGRPRVAIECKDVGKNGSLDEMRAFVARLYDTTLLEGHYYYLPFPEKRALHPASPDTEINQASGTFKAENDRTKNILARRLGFATGTPPLSAYYRIEPHAHIAVSHPSLATLVQSVVDWAVANAR